MPPPSSADPILSCQNIHIFKNILFIQKIFGCVQVGAGAAGDLLRLEAADRAGGEPQPRAESQDQGSIWPQLQVRTNQSTEFIY